MICNFTQSYPDNLKELKRFKKNYYGWIDPVYEYSGSMADGDWGWKKRSTGNSYNHHLNHQRDTAHYKSYFPSIFYQPRTSASSQNHYYEPSIVKQNRNYGFHSMADADWGWRKKRANKLDSKKEKYFPSKTLPMLVILMDYNGRLDPEQMDIKGKRFSYIDDVSKSLQNNKIINQNVHYIDKGTK
nr:uncharacterized protein LOC121126573 isoform X2 [Lepeophtheirus salmonis]